MRPLLCLLVCLPAFARPVTEHWSAPYRELHAHVVKIQEQVARKYIPELTLIKNGFTIASIPLDTVAATVLREADETFLPYRTGLQNCVESSQSEYRARTVASFEYFGWFLDNYVRTLNKALESQAEAEVILGVRERKVTSDRALYAFTTLLSAYLDERLDRFSNDAGSLSADTTLKATLADVARRVFRLDLSAKFDRREALQKGFRTQPVLRDLAADEGGADLSIALDPLAHLVSEPHSEALCRFALPPRGTELSVSR